MAKCYRVDAIVAHPPLAVECGQRHLFLRNVVDLVAVASEAVHLMFFFGLRRQNLKVKLVLYAFLNHILFYALRLLSVL